MSCAGNIVLHRNADYPFRIVFPAGTNLADSQPFLTIRARAGGPDLLTVSLAGTPNGTVFVLTGSAAVGIIKSDDVAALPMPDVEGEPWTGVYDIVFVDANGTRNWFIGGEVTVLNAGGIDGCGAQGGTQDYTISYESNEITISFESNVNLTGALTYSAGDGLDLVGQQFSIDLIEEADRVQALIDGQTTAFTRAVIAEEDASSFIENLGVFQTRAAAEAFVPTGALPPFIEVMNYATIGDGGGAVYQQASDLTIYGPEIVTNGTFTDDASGWTLDDMVWAAGKLQSLPGSTGFATQAVTFVPYQTYELVYTTSDRVSGSYTCTIINADTSLNQVLQDRATNGTFTTRFTARPNDTSFSFTHSSSYDGFLDNVSIRRVTDQGQLTIAGQQYIPMGPIFRPEQFGALSSSTGNVGFDRLTNRVNAYGPRARVEMPRRYYITRPQVFTPEQICLDGMGSGVIDCSLGSTTLSDPAIWLVGPGLNGQSTTLTANALQYATTITVASTANVSIGDVFAMTSNGEYFNGVAGNDGYGLQYKGELIQVTQVVNGTTLTLSRGLLDSYLASPNTVTLRKIVMNKGLTVKDLKFVGPGNGELQTATGIIGLRTDFWDGTAINNVTVMNFPGYAAAHGLSMNVNLLNPKVYGRDLADPTNDSPVSTWFYGHVIAGCKGVQITSPFARNCRRSVDLVAARGGDFVPNVSSAEGVITDTVAINGGTSENTTTLPLGHQSRVVTLTGHIGRSVITGQFRGKDIILADCDLQFQTNGFVVGIGNTSLNDISSFPEDPTCGYVKIIGCKIVATGIGLWGNVSFSRLHVSDTTIEAPIPVDLYGKHQSNIRFSNVTLTGDGTGPAFRTNNPTRIDGSNFSFTGGRIRNVTYGFDLTGATAAAGEYVISGVMFSSVTTAYVNMPSSGVWVTDGSLEISNCSFAGVTPTVPLSLATRIVTQYGNQFGVAFHSMLPISSGSVTLVDRSPIAFVRVQGSSPAIDLNTISGGYPGQIIVLKSSGNSSDVTVKNGVGNINLPADVALDNTLDKLMLTYDGTVWSAVAPVANNGA